MERWFDPDECHQNADDDGIKERGTENPSPPSLLLMARLYRFVSANLASPWRGRDSFEKKNV